MVLCCPMLVVADTVATVRDITFSADVAAVGGVIHPEEVVNDGVLHPEEVVTDGVIHPEPEVSELGPQVHKALKVTSIVIMITVAQARSGNSDSGGAFTHQMKELHLKLHQSGLETNVPLNAPRCTYSLAKIEGDKSILKHFDEHTSLSPSVLWNKRQIERPQAFQRTLPSIAVETNLDLDVKCNVVSNMNSKTPSPSQNNKDAELTTPESFQKVKIAKTGQSTIDNIPDSGFSHGSGNLYAYSAKQEKSMRFPHQKLHMAFKPIGAMRTNISPVPMNLTQPSQKPAHITTISTQSMQPQRNNPICHSTSPRVINQNTNNSSFSPRLLTPKSQSTMTSRGFSPRLLTPESQSQMYMNLPNVSERSTQLDPGFLSSFKTNDMNSKNAHNPSLQASSSTPLSSSANGSLTDFHITPLTSSPGKILTDKNTKPKEDTLEEQIEDFEMCSCNRSPRMIFCKACGETAKGRMRQKCKAHPNQIFLMDISCCPKCQSENLKEIADYNLT
ncbi:hypothetical protein ElyMa_004556500 [Elysia marginata]|uniref:Uncharacterized protein n=1 Tax=Elysia marginata TaxID=1093978 RepID=A0AAV4HUQ9_9GAST|nr:hypothetical protein ElyMa_004556500 [Elysia marginata]